jgi:hypothetical protein
VSEQTVLVLRGIVDVPDTSPAALAEQRLIERQAPGHGARTFKHRRLFHVGERLMLSAGDAERLARAGVVEIVL